MRQARLGLGALLVLMGTAHAQAPGGDEGLSGQIAFGYLATSGNTESENMNLTFGGEYGGEVWRHKLDGQAVKASSNNVTTAEAYGLKWQSRRALANESNYVFALAAWSRDEFSAYDQQLRQVVGYGRSFLDGERHSLDAEVGAGLRQADRRDGTSEDESIARLSADYEWVVSETATFSQTLSIESGSDNTYSEWVSKLSADVWQNFAIVLSYTIKRNSDVPAGTVKRDTFTAVSIEYSF